MEIQDSPTKYFSFGCSYTQYGYPTYADFLGQHFDIRENLGHSGAGNRYIFHKLVASISVLQREGIELTENDLITVQWSGLPREDKIRRGDVNYPCAGYLGSQGYFPDEWVDEWFSIEQNFFELVNYINITKRYLSSLGVQYKMFYMMDYNLEDFLGEAFQYKAFNKKFDTLKTSGYLSELTNALPESIESVETFRIKNTLDKEKPYGYSWTDENGNVVVNDDTHPVPYTHYEYAKYLSSKLTKDLMEDDPRDYTELFEWCDDHYKKENIQKMSHSINSVHLEFDRFGIEPDNCENLSRYRNPGITEYLKNYKPII
jgi:hypothetical protein